MHLTFYETLFITASPAAHLQVRLLRQKTHAHNVNFTKLSISPPSSSAALWSEKIFQIQPHNETEVDGKIT